MKRRDVLAGAALAATPLLAAPAIGGSVRRLTMVTEWPEGPGLLPSARRLARTIGEASDGRLEIEVLAAGERVRPLECVDAVAAGVADLAHTHFGYYGRLSSAFHFYSGVPFGLTPGEFFAWVRAGEGQALWDELGARFDVKPLPCGSTGPQMGGWFREPLDSIEDVRGLRYRMAGLGAEVYRELGAAVVLLAPGDIVQALGSGAIDACEWTGPWLDVEMGLPGAARHYYYPGWHEPTGVISLGIGRALWDGLEPSERRLIEAAADAEYARSLAEFDARNAAALARLRAEGEVELHRFDDASLARFAEVGADVVAAAGEADALARRVRASHERFLEGALGWSEVGAGAFLEARARAS